LAGATALGGIYPASSKSGSGTPLFTNAAAGHVAGLGTASVSAVD
jgi:hypothetical protein